MLRKRNGIAYSNLLEVCEAHSKAKTTVALYEGEDAAGLQRSGEVRTGKVNERNGARKKSLYVIVDEKE